MDHRSLVVSIALALASSGAQEAAHGIHRALIAIARHHHQQRHRKPPETKPAVTELPPAKGHEQVYRDDHGRMLWR